LTGRRRALSLFLASVTFIALSWAWGAAANHAYGLDGTPTKIDFRDGAWAVAVLLYLVWGFGDAFVQCWVYWLLGQLSDSPEVLSRLAGAYKGVQCLGATASWALSTGSIPPSTQLWVNVGLLALALPATSFMVLRTPELDKKLPAETH